MSANKDPQSYLMAAGGLAFVAAGIPYCAVNWDDPPEWWPNSLQPWWNKKEPEMKQTDQFVKHVDEGEETQQTQQTQETTGAKIGDSTEKLGEEPKEKPQQNQEQQENIESEVAALKDNLVKSENVENN